MKIITNKDLKQMYERKVANKMHAFGDTDIDKKVIRINKKKSKASGKKGELLDTIVHEETHAKHPKMYERTVRKKTKQTTKHMTRRQKQSAYARYR